MDGMGLSNIFVKGNRIAGFKLIELLLNATCFLGEISAHFCGAAKKKSEKMSS